MNGLEKIDRYVEQAGLSEEFYDQYGLDLAEFTALVDTASVEYAVLTAYAYGMVRGWRAAGGARDGL